MRSWVSDYARALEKLTADNLGELATYLAEKVEFRDPFNHSYSRDDFMAIMSDMFQQLDDVSFEIHECLRQKNSGAIYWTFHAKSKWTKEIHFEGMSRLKADDLGHIVLHQDHWDASELMQKLPLLGIAIGKLRHKMAHIPKQ